MINMGGKARLVVAWLLVVRACATVTQRIGFTDDQLAPLKGVRLALFEKNVTQ